MSIVSIIAEYNPFHNGHAYHINKSKEITKSDYVIVVMSGSFTQLGNIAIYDKFIRSKLAIDNGADLVIELPTIFSNSSSEFFAHGAINLLSKLNIVDYLSFGSEVDNLDFIKDISNIIINNEDAIWKSVKVELTKGISFAKARQEALSLFMNDSQIKKCSLSNNILAIEYLNSIQKLNSDINPVLVQRLESDYNEINLNNSNLYTSATSIRNIVNNSYPLEKKELFKLSKYVPDNTLNKIERISPTSNDSLFELIKYKIISKDSSYISSIHEVTEGIENKLYKAINESNSYEEFVTNIKSKRYQLSKIKRMLINILLDITKEDFNSAVKNPPNYAHILGCSTNGKTLLSKISNNSNISLITSINNNIIDNLNVIDKKNIQLDILASNIYSILNNQKINKDYTNRL